MSSTQYVINPGNSLPKDVDKSSVFQDYQLKEIKCREAYDKLDNFTYEESSFNISSCMPSKFLLGSDNMNPYPEAIFNFSIDEVMNILEETRKGYLHPSVEILFIVCYSILIIFGVVGNFMVGYVIWRKKTMRSARNLYILNLTLSDLTMCIICMPITLISLLYKDWTFGSALCKLVPIIQGTNILVSTATIVAIAADRHFSIVRVGRANRKRWHVAGSLALVWVVSMVFTLPLYPYYYVDHVVLGRIVLYRRCVERWPSRFVKEVWVVLLLIIQYIFPIAVLSVVHVSIKRYLGKHITVRRNDQRAHREMSRNKKTTILLTIIAVAFAISWLPWHVVSLLADFNYSSFKDSNFFYTVFGACHIIAMSSACFNPVLYGWLNTNLRRELLDFLPAFFKRLCCLLQQPCPQENASQINKANNNNLQSQIRPAESITLSVYQPSAGAQPSVEDILPMTTAITLASDVN